MTTLQKTKNAVIETVERVKAPTSDYHKGVRKYGLILSGVGLTIKILAAIFPATMPIGIVSLAPELITIGLTAAGVAQTVKKN